MISLRGLLVTHYNNSPPLAPTGLGDINIEVHRVDAFGVQGHVRCREFSLIRCFARRGS